MKGNGDNINILAVLSDMMLKIKELYLQLLEVSQGVTAAVTEQNYDKLSALLGKRQVLMDEIDKINGSKNFLELREKLIHEYKLKSGSWIRELIDRDELDEETLIVLLKEIESVLQQLVDIDKSNKENFDKLYLEVKQGMQRVKKGMKINNNYNKKTRIYSTFIDRKN